MENVKMMSDEELIEAIENAKANNENPSKYEKELNERKASLMN